jgi:hypothetical protein
VRRSLLALVLALGSTAIVLPIASFGTLPVARGQERVHRDETDLAGADGADLLEASGDDSGDVTAQSELRGEGGGKVKVFRFTGLGLDARLKSPQLLYFLNRLRAEFDRPRLPHRSFIPELQRSSKSKTF